MNLKADIRDFLPKISTQLPNGYSHKAKNQARQILENGINDQAPSRINVEGITIDDAESLDLDDGIWAEKRNDGGYTIFISIADPTEAIDPLSPIDLDAINKATSVYTSTHTIHMLPKLLSTDLISLNHNTKKLSKTIQIDYDSEMNVINTKIEESIFYNKKRFDYRSFGESFQYEGSEFHEELNLMWEIARKLRSKRKNKVNFDFNESDRKMEDNYKSIEKDKGNFDFNESYKKDDDNYKSIRNKKYIASILIEEFMVAGNIEVARYIIKNQVNGIFRAHMPEYKDKYVAGDQMERAYYSIKNMYHYGLGENDYLHTTSPMRRLADYMLDRFLKAHIRNDEEPYSIEESIELVNYINLQVNSIVLLEREHNFQSKITFKSRKLIREGEDFNVSDIKEHIRNGVGKGYKLPKDIKEQIINSVKNGEGKDWHWIITPYLVSRETEIIEVLKEKVIGNITPTALLNIISKNIVQRKESSVFKVSEKIKNKRGGKKEYSISIFFKEEKIFTNKGDERILHRIKKETVSKIFDYFIERSKRY